MRKNLFILLIVLFAVTACTLIRTVEIIEYDRVPQTKNQNVCKFMDDSVLVYAIFVDVDIYHPWTEFDIRTTMDSLQKATSWLEQQASRYQKKPFFSVVQHDQSGKWTINEGRAKVSLTLNGITASMKGKNIRKLNPWADAIAKYAGRGVKYNPSGKVATRLKIQNKQSLILALRDKYERENVALIFFVNGYYENHPSYTIFSETNGPDVEYSIITTKNPAVISHELLHLFGAVDLYPTIAYPNFNHAKIAEKHPDEIMRIQHKQLDKLNVSPITAYFVGWQDTLDDNNTNLLLHKKMLTEY